MIIRPYKHTCITFSPLQGQIIIRPRTAQHFQLYPRIHILKDELFDNYKGKKTSLYPESLRKKSIIIYDYTIMPDKKPKASYLKIEIEG